MSTHFSYKNSLAPIISLFTSAGTLVCCALPALFVSLGMGATLAGLTSNFPALIWISRYKEAVFLTALILIILSGLMMWKARNLACPTDPKQAKTCSTLRKVSWWIWGFSVVTYLTGAFFAFAAPILFF